MRIAFVDFEASGLDIDPDDFSFKTGTFPIEIGISVLDTETDEIKTWSSLIRTDPAWDAKMWSAEAEAVHGISRDDLMTAPVPGVVAAAAFSLVSTCDYVVPGHSVYDGRWGDMLFAASPIAFRFYKNSVSLQDLQTQGIITLEQYFNMPSLPEIGAHRAGADSADMANAFLTMLREHRFESFDF